MSRVLHTAGVRWYFRVPAKLAIFGLVVLAVEFPYPAVLVRHMRHIGDMSCMVDPNAPELVGFERDFHAWFEHQRATTRPAATQAAVSPGSRVAGVNSESRLPAASTSAATRPAAAREVQRAVERFVYDRVRYDWDWNLWGVADYMPTVSEMFARAREYKDGGLREDCDGRAVMAASLLKRLGYNATIVTDFRHVWVQVREPNKPPLELMGPGRAKSVVATAQGNKVNWLTTLTNIPVALSFGIAVFPWLREAIIYVTLMLLLWHPRAAWRSTAIGVILAFAGWHFLRMGVVSIGEAGDPGYRWDESPVNAWLGVAYTLAGCGVMSAASFRARRAGTTGLGAKKESLTSD